jgi:hypothetical protein
MVIRICRKWFSVVASVLLACGLLAGIGVAAAGPASALPEISICLTNAPTYCADVKDANNTPGASIWLWRTSDGANDYKWLEWQVPCTDSICICEASSCLEFQDAQDPGQCLGTNQAGNAIILLGCQTLQGGTPRAAWIYSNNFPNNLESWALHNNYDLTINLDLS